MFQRIGNKIILVYGGITIIAMLGLMWFYALQQEKNILAQNELTMGKMAQSITAGLRSVMLAGYADIAQDYTHQLQQVPDILEFKIARRPGYPAPGGTSISADCELADFPGVTCPGIGG